MKSSGYRGDRSSRIIVVDFDLVSFFYPIVSHFFCFSRASDSRACFWSFNVAIAVAMDRNRSGRTFQTQHQTVRETLCQRPTKTDKISLILDVKESCIGG